LDIQRAGCFIRCAKNYLRIIKGLTESFDILNKDIQWNKEQRQDIRLNGQVMTTGFVPP
jgi:hypothetical protein